MGIFNFLRTADVNEGVERFRGTSGAMLLDVRSREEYRSGHIPGSVNLPLNRLAEAEAQIPGKDTPLFVYCLSGGRSRQAVAVLKEMGYHNISNIGGVSAYKGKLEG